MRVAVAAAASCDLAVHRSGRDVGDEVLEPRPVDRAVRVTRARSRWRSRRARRGSRTPLSRASRRRRRRWPAMPPSSNVEDGLDAEAPAPPARAGRVGQVLEAMQEVRVDDLEHLRVLRRDRAARGDQADVVVAVRAVGPAAASLAGVDQDVDVRRVARGRPAGDDRRQEVVPARGHLASGTACGEREHDHGGDLVGEVVAEAGRRRVTRVDEASLAGDHLDAAHDPVVVGQLLLGDHEERDHHRRDRDCQRRVHVAGRLAVGPAEVEGRCASPSTVTASRIVPWPSWSIPSSWTYHSAAVAAVRDPRDDRPARSARPRPAAARARSNGLAPVAARAAP